MDIYKKIEATGAALAKEPFQSMPDYSNVSLAKLALDFDCLKIEIKELKARIEAVEER